MALNIAETRGIRLRPLELRGVCLNVQTATDTEIVISGPAGTGKSLACLEKLHRCANQFAGFRGLILRKTRESLSDTGLVTLERDVLGAQHYAVLDGPQRNFRQAYRFGNGSQIVIGGLDKASRFLSGEYDLIFVQQAEEIIEDDWELLTTRLRNGRMPYQQILGDCNPSTPRHWIRQRERAGRLQLMESRHQDNPQLWNDGGWTNKGREYLIKLNALTGPRKDRLRYGRWVQAEGIVYEGYDSAVHLIPKFNIPPDWYRFRAVDFGYTNPFVCQWWAVDPDGRMYRYREIYHTKRTVHAHAQQILALSASESIQATVCDHDAEDMATLRECGITTLPANKSVSVGIQKVQERLKIVGDGKARLFCLHDSLVERDPDLIEAKRPTCTEEEIDSYVWSNKGMKDEPVKAYDHGMDALRYAVMHLDTQREVEYERVITYPERVVIGDYA